MNKLSPEQAREIVLAMFHALYLGGLSAEEAADIIEEVVESLPDAPISCDCNLLEGHTQKRKRNRS